MKVFVSSFLFLFLAACSTLIFAQSKPPEDKTDDKKNQRQNQPSPTPPKNASPQSDNQNQQPTDDGEVIKVTTQLVSVPVRVMDKKGRFIGGLKKTDFKIFENRIEQEVALFSNEHQPFTVVLVLDMSYSTKFKIGEIQSAAIAFIAQLRPQDRVSVVSFDDDVHMLCEATSDRKEIFRAIKTTKIATGTSLYEAVDLVMNERLREIEGRKAIILFTDGVDTSSRRSSDYENLKDALELDALVYPIRYDTFADVQKLKNAAIIPRLPQITISSTGQVSDPTPIPLPTVGKPDDQGTTEKEYKKAEEYLDQLAQRTGGRLYQATTLVNLADAYSRIASELREFYSISYYPSEDRVAGKKANLKIKIEREGLVVRSRESIIRRKENK